MIHQQFRKTAAAFPGETAIVDGPLRMTYGRLAQEVDRARGWLRRAGAAEGTVIALSLRNSWQFVVSFLAIVESGGAVLLCNPGWRAAELRRLTEQLPIRGVLAEENLRGEWDQIDTPILTWDGAASCESSNAGPPAARLPQSALAYLVTSGSTGTPKLVPRTGANLSFGPQQVSAAFGLARGSKWLCVTPFFHSWGLHAGLLMPLLRGDTLVLMPQFQPAACAELIRREQVNVLMASPFAYTFLTDHVARPADVASLKLCLWSGSRMKAGVVEIWRDRFALRLRPWYGMSEASVIAIDLAAEPARGEEGFVGQPVPGAEVRICDSDGQVLGAGETGEVVVQSDGVMPGYAGSRDENRHDFFGPFFRTGDLGRLDGQGHLRLSGRARMRINIAGLKVDAVEIERAVEMLDAVAACRVDAVAGGPAGETIRAQILLRDGHTLSRREVVEHCRRQLAEYKIPRLIEFSDAAGSLPAVKLS